MGLPRKLLKAFLLFSILLHLYSLSFAQNSSTLSGLVIELESQKPLSGVLIKNQQSNIIVITDEEGKFAIEHLSLSKFYLQCILPGYPRLFVSVQMPASGDTSITIYLPHSNSSLDIFMLGGIEVEAKRDLLPKDYAATTTISSGEIENLQASSLGDVLEMIPGLEKTNRLGLDNSIHANVRGQASDYLGTFGTKIIIDETVFSNNANMQMSSGGTVTSSAGQGIDLRLIPADNIESVEVIRGIPSAKYGDLTSGLIKVKTYSGLMSPRLKMKSNPNTTEANFGTGFDLAGNVFNVNLNYGFSERELRKEGDEYHRFNLSLITTRRFLNNQLPIKWKIFATRFLDEEKPTDVHKMSAYNRGYTLNTDVWGEYSPNSLLNYQSNIYFHYTRKNTFSSRLVEADPSSYMGELRMIGDEVNIGGRSEMSQKIIFPSAVHQITAGVEFQYDNNFGKGLIIDTTNHYFGPDSPKRSYSFDEVPSISQVSFYLEDCFTGRLWKEFNLIFGLRYDLFKPKGFNLRGLWTSEDFIESQHGSFLSPRLGLLFYLTPTTQLRGGYGVSAKIPSINYIFKPEEILFYCLDYISYDQSNYNLQGYNNREIKLGLDQELFDLFSISLEGYYSWRQNEPIQRSYPFFYETNPDTFWVPTYSIYENIGWEKQNGIEGVFKTGYYNGISLTVNATYRFNRSGYDVLIYNGDPDPVDKDGDGSLDGFDLTWRDIKDNWKKKLLIDYRLEYRSELLGLWFQFIAQQIPLYQTKSNNPYQKGIWANYLKKYPDNWVFNFRLSKSLWWGSEISLYVNNFLDDRGIYEVPWLRDYYPQTDSWGRKVFNSRNNPIFWGFEFSTKLDF